MYAVLFGEDGAKRSLQNTGDRETVSRIKDLFELPK